MLAVSAETARAESGWEPSSCSLVTSRVVSCRFIAATGHLLLSVARTLPQRGHTLRFRVGGPMTYTACSPMTRRFSIATLALVTLAAAAISVEAGPRRARLSRDLSERLAARVDASTDVIVTGSDEQVNELATRYGARVKKRLKNAAVFEVTGAQLAISARTPTSPRFRATYASMRSRPSRQRPSAPSGVAGRDPRRYTARPAAASASPSSTPGLMSGIRTSGIAWH